MGQPFWQPNNGQPFFSVGLNYSGGGGRGGGRGRYADELDYWKAQRLHERDAFEREQANLEAQRKEAAEAERIQQQMLGIASRDGVDAANAYATRAWKSFGLRIGKPPKLKASGLPGAQGEMELTDYGGNSTIVDPVGDRRRMARLEAEAFEQRRRALIEGGPAPTTNPAAAAPSPGMPVTMPDDELAFLMGRSVGQSGVQDLTPGGSAGAEMEAELDRIMAGGALHRPTGQVGDLQFREQPSALTAEAGAMLPSIGEYAPNAELDAILAGTKDPRAPHEMRPESAEADVYMALAQAGVKGDRARKLMEDGLEGRERAAMGGRRGGMSFGEFMDREDYRYKKKGEHLEDQEESRRRLANDAHKHRKELRDQAEETRKEIARIQAEARKTIARIRAGAKSQGDALALRKHRDDLVESRLKAKGNPFLAPGDLDQIDKSIAEIEALMGQRPPAALPKTGSGSGTAKAAPDAAGQPAPDQGPPAAASSEASRPYKKNEAGLILAKKNGRHFWVTEAQLSKGFDPVYED